MLQNPAGLFTFQVTIPISRIQNLIMIIHSVQLLMMPVVLSILQAIILTLQIQLSSMVFLKNLAVLFTLREIILL